jgi:hypothetical protein
VDVITADLLIRGCPFCLEIFYQLFNLFTTRERASLARALLSEAAEI